MGFIDDFEKRTGLTFDELTSEEKESFFSAISNAEKSQLTIDKFRDYISEMREAVEMELIKEPEFIRWAFFKFDNRKQILLKARLQNYILISMVLSSPEKAKEFVNNMINRFPAKQQDKKSKA